MALLGLWRSPVRLLVVRRGNPLCFSETPGGFYFASLPAGLSDQVFSITDEYAGVLRLEGGTVKHQDFSILA